MTNIAKLESYKDYLNIPRKINVWLFLLNNKWILNNDNINSIKSYFWSDDIKKHICEVKQSSMFDSENYKLSIISNTYKNTKYSEILFETDFILYKLDDKISEIVEEHEDWQIESYLSPLNVWKEKKRRIFQRHKIIFFKHPNYFNQSLNNEEYFGLILSESTQWISYNFSWLEDFINDFIVSKKEEITQNNVIRMEKLMNNESLERLFSWDIDWIDLSLSSNSWLAYNELSEILWINNNTDEESFTETPISNEEMFNKKDLNLKLKFILELSKKDWVFKKIGWFFQNKIEKIFKNKKTSQEEENSLYWNIRFKTWTIWHSLFDLSLSFDFSCKIIETDYIRKIVSNTDTKYFFENITDTFLDKCKFLKDNKIDLNNIYKTITTFKND